MRAGTAILLLGVGLMIISIFPLELDRLIGPGDTGSSDAPLVLCTIAGGLCLIGLALMLRGGLKLEAKMILLVAGVLAMMIGALSFDPTPGRICKDWPWGGWCGPNCIGDICYPWL